MNKYGYWSQKNACKTIEYKFVHEKMRVWKQTNGITEQCVVHHRDDNEEVRVYNEEHYERWGLDENGDFVEGKYVVFMTLSDHMKHHRIGKSSPMKGKTHTDEVKAKISKNNAHYWKGKKLSSSHVQHLHESHADFSGKSNPFYGKHHSDATKEKMSTAKKGKTISDEHKANIRASKKAQFAGIKVLYATYKNNGGILNWNDFQRALKNGEITFEVQPITVYTK